MARNWETEKDDKLLFCMAHGTSEERCQAFEAFYRRHSPYLYGICYDLANRYKFGFFDHDDIFELTMIKARDNAKTFKADGITEAEELEDAADAWLGGIASNVVIDLVRRKPKCDLINPQLLNALESEEVLCVQVEDAFCGDETEDQSLVRAAIDTLSPAEQAVIWATSLFYERRQHQRTPTEALDEIIGFLRISRDNYRKIKQRAKKKIQEFMANHKLTPEAK